MNIKLFFGALLIVIFSVSGGLSDEIGAVSYSVVGDFEDVVFDLENAIIDEGLVVDYRGQVNEMLERTSEVVGMTSDGEKSPYLEAMYMHFCSAILSHEAMDADPANLSICPYVVFAYETRKEPGVVHVGYRRPFGGPTEATKLVWQR
jgi:hypothetical protein